MNQGQSRVSPPSAIANAVIFGAIGLAIVETFDIGVSGLSGFLLAFVIGLLLTSTKEAHLTKRAALDPSIELLKCPHCGGPVRLSRYRDNVADQRMALGEVE